MAEGMMAVRRAPGLLRPLLYEGGESSRIYEGDYRVEASFTWADGTPGATETEASDYLTCQRWLLLAGEGLPMHVTDPDTGHAEMVRLTSAHIEPARG